MRRAARPVSRSLLWGCALVRRVAAGRPTAKTATSPGPRGPPFGARDGRDARRARARPDEQRSLPKTCQEELGWGAPRVPSVARFLGLRARTAGRGASTYGQRHAAGSGAARAPIRGARRPPHAPRAGATRRAAFPPQNVPRGARLGRATRPDGRSLLGGGFLLVFFFIKQKKKEEELLWRQKPRRPNAPTNRRDKKRESSEHSVAVGLLLGLEFQATLDRVTAVHADELVVRAVRLAALGKRRNGAAVFLRPEALGDGARDARGVSVRAPQGPLTQ